MQRVKTFEECVSTVPDIFKDGFFLQFRKWLGAPLSFLPQNLRNIFPRGEFITECTEEEFTKYKAYNEKCNSIRKGIKHKYTQADLFGQSIFTFNEKDIVWVCTNPTFNCQLASFASFQCILEEISDIETLEIILRHVSSVVGKYQFYFDVNYGYKKYIDQLCFEQINPSEYISTNGSKMYDGKLLINR